MANYFSIIAFLLINIGRLSSQESFTFGDFDLPLGGEDNGDAQFKACGNLVTNENEGWVTSPGYPDPYPPVARCNTTIVAPIGHVIEYQSSVMDVEEPDPSSSLCVYDYVRVYDDDVLSNTYCGKQALLPNVTTSNRLTLMFVSDYTTEVKGFVLNWKVVNPNDRGISLNCNFDEAIALCAGWTNENKDYKWLFTREDTPSANTGPIADHTTGSSEGRYAYIEASKVDEDTIAILQSPAIISEGIQDKRCLRFWYHMFGETMGSLSVLLKDSDGNSKLVDSFDGNKGDVWNEGEYTITLESLMNTIVFEGKRGSNYKSDMAIDDITITRGECNQPERSLTIGDRPFTSLSPWLGGGTGGGSLVPSDCPTNMVKENCGDSCNLSCDDALSLDGGTPCLRACMGDCACPMDLPVFTGGSCISLDECLVESTTQSPTNQSKAVSDESTTVSLVESTGIAENKKYGKKEEIHDHIVRHVLNAIASALAKFSNN